MTIVAKPTPTTDLISAHGGALVNRIVPQREAEALARRAASFPQIAVSPEVLTDLELLATGAFSPLIGFFNHLDYESVLATGRLPDGTVWPIPLVLPVDESTRRSLKPGRPAALIYDGEVYAVIDVEDIYSVDKRREANLLFKTTEDRHPGVATLLRDRSDFLVGGPVRVIRIRTSADFPPYRLTPRDTRRLFRDRGWRSVVGFQTRNPMHRAHEYLTKVALETVDGLFLHPLVGPTKTGDIPAEVRMRCYEVLLERYYPKNRVVMAVYPAAMRYAGPREAVLHAIVRQNYGCTHFIVGRDHAGVGGFYGLYEAQDLLKSFTRKELAITPLCFEQSFWCKKTGGMATNKTTNSSEEERVYFSGSEVRAMLASGKAPPPEITRPEVAQILLEARI